MVVVVVVVVVAPLVASGTTPLTPMAHGATSSSTPLAVGSKTSYLIDADVRNYYDVYSFKGLTLF